MGPQGISQKAPSAVFADRVGVYESKGGSYLVMPVSTPDIVSFEGSFVNIPAFSSGEGLVRDLTISMLDKGTKTHSKLDLAELLEGMGADLTFSSDGIRVRVSGRALRKDLPAVFRVLSEELHQPLFPPDELDLLKGRYEAAFRRRLTNTSSAASSALSRRIFGQDHPNFVPKVSDELDRLARIGVGDITGYFNERTPISDWKLAIVGDVEWKDVSGIIEDTFPLSTPLIRSAIRPWETSSCQPGREEVHIDDRDNIDVRIGHLVESTSTDPSFLPLFLGVYVLGGNFSARLMSIIRDQMGLTYGIHSSLSQADALHYGMWYTSVTLSRSDLEKGIHETLRLLDEFVGQGISGTELDEKKTTVAGSYKVGLSSTGALAGALLRNAEKQRDPYYLDQFPGIIAAVSLDEVNREISNSLCPDHLHVSLAGSLNTVSGGPE